MIPLCSLLAVQTWFRLHTSFCDYSCLGRYKRIFCKLKITINWDNVLKGEQAYKSRENITSFLNLGDWWGKCWLSWRTERHQDNKYSLIQNTSAGYYIWHIYASLQHIRIKQTLEIHTNLMSTCKQHIHQNNEERQIKNAVCMSWRKY